MIVSRLKRIEEVQHHLVELLRMLHVGQMGRIGDGNVLGKYVRVTGYVTGRNNMGNSIQLVELSHDDATLWVDTSLVVTSELKTDTQVQFIGEMTAAAPAVISHGASYQLTAKVMRIVDGLDMRLYEEALVARRQFLAAN